MRQWPATCPISRPLGRYHWSILQAAYTTDILFRGIEDLARCTTTRSEQPFTRSRSMMSPPSSAARLSALVSVRPAATSLFDVRPAPRRYPHPPLQGTSLDQDVRQARLHSSRRDRDEQSFFRHHRMVEQRDGQRVFKLAALLNSIYSLSPDLASISRAANDRYIQFHLLHREPTPGVKVLSKISESVEERKHRYRGLICSMTTARHSSRFSAAVSS